MNCPKCGKPATLKCVVRPATTAVGIGAGGYVALAAGGKTGAVVGSAFCPGIGTVVGSLLGILVGAASGAVAGNTVGRLLDENIVRVYRCEPCNHTWRA